MSLDRDNLLESLRDMETGRRPYAMTFAEWSHEQDQLAKYPASGGRQSSLAAPYGQGAGMMGGYAYSSSRAPAGPNFKPSGNIGLGYKPEPSRYATERTAQPPPWINDVDMESIWYSPMEPVWPFGPPYYNRPRDWDYPVGYNLNYIPQRIAQMQLLRGMRYSWGILATIIETRKDQLLRLPWSIQRRDKPKATSKAVDEMRKFFRRPDGKFTFGQWARRIMDDLFVIDAPCLYMSRSNGGALRHAEQLDGMTIFPLIDDAGRRPDTEYTLDRDGVVYEERQPAFQQIIYGLPMVNLSEDELIYAMMRPRAELPVFGYSPVEQIMVEATEAIRKTFYQLEFWRSGSMPELIVTVPDNWTPRQIAMFQGHFDALLSGQLTLKSKVRFLPGGMKPFDIKNASGESLWSQRDETLVRLACFAFSIPPTPFVRQMNRGTAQNAQQTAQEEGLYPLMSWWKDDIMDTIIQEKFGYDDIEFVFLPRPEVDQEKQSKIHQVQIDEGLRSRNEVRAELGEEPIEDGDIYTVKTGTGVVPLDLVVSGEAMAMVPGAGGEKPDGGSPAKKPANQPRSVPQRGAPTAAPGGMSKEATVIAPDGEIFKVNWKDVKDASKDAEGGIHDYSHLQLKNGNYPKGHIWIQGLNISIENRKGSKRGEKDQHGVKWQVKMPSPYGYIRGTIGADGMAVDVYLGKKPKSTTVWVIDQDKVTPEGTNKGFDEHKVMLGYKSLKKALKDYLASHFDGHGHERIAAVTELQMPAFKAWLKSGDMKEPISQQGVGEVVMRRSIRKFDTISQSTNLMHYSQLPAKRKRRKKIKSQGPRWLQLGAEA